MEDSHSDLFVWDGEYTPPTPWIGKETISCCREIEQETEGEIGWRRRGGRHRVRNESWRGREKIVDKERKKKGGRKTDV